MSLVLIGLNHKTASLEVREQLAFNEAECAANLPFLVDGEIVREALLISTCNRVEVVLEGDATGARARVIDFFERVKGFDRTAFADHLYEYVDAEATAHLFNVTAALDSMIVGEAQIMGQVRRAYATAVTAKTVGRMIHKLLHHAFHVAKRVRTETRVAQGGVSLSYVAVERARKVFGSLDERTVLLVGAGEMAELAAKHLQAGGAKRILIANRTRENAERLANEFDGEAVDFARLPETLQRADIVICSTAASEPLVTAEMIAAAQTKRALRPAVLVDLGVPRNIEPDVRRVENVFLSDVDDLQTVVQENLRERQAEAVRAADIIADEVTEFEQSLSALNFGQTLGDIRQKLQNTARREFDRQRNKLGDLTPEQTAAVEALLLATVNKISHPLLYGLRRSHEAGATEFAEILSTMLGSEQ